MQPEPAMKKNRWQRKKYKNKELKELLPDRKILQKYHEPQET